MKRTLEDRVILITGGARGQGAAHGRECAEQGATVVLADVLDDIGRAQAQSLREQGLPVEYHHLDVTSESQWQSTVAQIEADHGKLDGLINNAGIVRIALPENEEFEAFMKVMTVNAAGVFLGIKTAAEAMRRAGGGAIVNIGSTNAHRGTPSFISYNASKAAVVNMTRSAAVAYADDGIRVNSISPGWVITPMVEAEDAARGMTDDWRFKSIIAPRTLVKEQGAPRGAMPDEISPAVAFLLSEAATFVTGTDLLVDGGALAW